MEEHFDSEIQILLRKYAGGRMPPLVDIGTPDAGLIDSDLLQIYYSGLQSRSATPLGILLAADQYTSTEEKWLKGDFTLNRWAVAQWSPFCKTLRDTEVGNGACESCDRHCAVISERENDVIAYLCDQGLIDFAVPIAVKGRVVAVLISGQFKPEEGPVWNSEMIHPEGFFRMLAPGEEGVDVWRDESMRRIRNIAKKADLSEELPSLLSLVETVSPHEVEEYKQLLRKIASQISDLATSTYELEKSKIVDWIRNQITRSLAPLSLTSAGTVEVWKQLSLGLEYVTTYFELDYALVLSCCDETKEEIRILCHSGLSDGDFPVGESRPTSRLSLSQLRSAVCGLEGPASILLQDSRYLPIFSQLYHLHTEQSREILVIPVRAPLGYTASVVILGRFGQDTTIEDFSSDDREALTRVIEEVTSVVNIVLLVEQLEGTARKQALFLEDVAHDIRTPIQNIVFESEMLTRELVPPDEIGPHISKVAAQVRRLHLVSQKAWTLVNIDRGVFRQAGVEQASVFQIVMEQRKLLADLAQKRSIQILVDRELQGWPAIQVNKDLFAQAVLNLIDNAVKYSRDGTDVRIDGKRLPDGINLSFVNRGIPIREGEKDKIFDRYYRTDEAKVHIPGTGIGLAIVKAFVDQCEGSIEVKSMPISGTRDYVTEFKVFIPQKGG